MEPKDKFENIWSNRSDQELYDALNHYSDYQIEAVKAMNRVFISRGLDSSKIPNVGEITAWEIKKKKEIEEEEYKIQPMDNESLLLLDTLPKRIPLISGMLSILRLLSMLILGFGVIGLIKVVSQDYDETTDFTGYILQYVLVGGVLAIGGILYFFAEYFLYKRAPIGNLIQNIFEGLEKNKIDKVRSMSLNIITKTNAIKVLSKSYLFSRMIAFEMLAEIGDDKKYALRVIPLCRKLIEQGIKTPFVYFCFGTAAKIAKMKEDAIEGFTLYLSMRPLDEEAREIWKNLYKNKYQ